MTWSEAGWRYRPYHYYAMLDGDGAFLVPPTPALAARIPRNGNAPVIMSSSNGYGAAPSNSFAPVSATQPAVKVETPALSTGAPNGGAQLGIRVSNRGLAVANGATVTVELDPLLSFVAATPAPTVAAQAADAGAGLSQPGSHPAQHRHPLHHGGSQLSGDGHGDHPCRRCRPRQQHPGDRSAGNDAMFHQNLWRLPL